jgi:hypothetical protein
MNRWSGSSGWRLWESLLISAADKCIIENIVIDERKRRLEIETRDTFIGTEYVHTTTQGRSQSAAPLLGMSLDLARVCSAGHIGRETEGKRK